MITIMSSLSQTVWYLNAEKHPGTEELKMHYTSISITDELKKIRRKILAEKKEGR